MLPEEPYIAYFRSRCDRMRDVVLAEPVQQFGGSGSQTEALLVLQAEFAVDRFLAFDQFPDLLFGQRIPEQEVYDRARRASEYLFRVVVAIRYAMPALACRSRRTAFR